MSPRFAQIILSVRKQRPIKEPVTLPEPNRPLLENGSTSGFDQLGVPVDAHRLPSGRGNFVQR